MTWCGLPARPGSCSPGGPLCPLSRGSSPSKIFSRQAPSYKESKVRTTCTAHQITLLSFRARGWRSRARWGARWTGRSRAQTGRAAPGHPRPLLSGHGAGGARPVGSPVDRARPRSDRARGTGSPTLPRSRISAPSQFVTIIQKTSRDTSLRNLQCEFG